MSSAQWQQVGKSAIGSFIVPLDCELAKIGDEGV